MGSLASRLVVEVKVFDSDRPEEFRLFKGPVLELTINKSAYVPRAPELNLKMAVMKDAMQVETPKIDVLGNTEVVQKRRLSRWALLMKHRQSRKNQKSREER